MITVQPWDVSQIGPIEKAIRAADLGVNPSNDGKMIRIPIPPLTEERRKELVEETARTSPKTIAWRSATSAATPTKHVKKLLEREEDHRRRRPARRIDEMQKLTDSYMQKLDQAAKAKEKEILEIR